MCLRNKKKTALIISGSRLFFRQAECHQLFLSKELELFEIKTITKKTIVFVFGLDGCKLIRSKFFIDSKRGKIRVKRTYLFL